MYRELEEVVEMYRRTKVNFFESQFVTAFSVQKSAN
jgi:hypothetical protein